jgi:gliding motility-associated-like protein/uncharacterized repeat protein (TIGR01451 family)
MTFKPLTIISLFFFLLGLQPLLAQVNPLERPGTFNSDLQLTKTSDKLTARVGSIVNFTIKVKNLGPSKSEGSAVFDLLPNGFTFISSSLPAEYNSITGEWDVDELAVNAEATLVITATVNPITPTSVYTNTAQIVDVKNTDPNQLNNRAECTVVPFDFTSEVTGEFTGVGGAICANSASILRASSTNIIEPIYKWYADAQLTNLVHIGANYITPPLSFTTTYFLVVTGTNIPAPTPADAKLVVVNVLQSPTAPDVTLVQPTCEVSTGIIRVSSPLLPGFTYSIDGATYLNNSGVFTNINPGTYAVTVKSNNGCISPNTTIVINKNPQSPAAPSLDIIQPTCTVATGAISISSPKSVGYTYSIDGKDYTNLTGEFTQVAPGTYNVSVKNTNGCVSPSTKAVVNPNPLAPAKPTVEVSNPVCPAKTGTINISSPTGNGFTFSIDGSTYLNNTGVFTSVAPGTYRVSVKNESGCISPSVVVTVSEPVVNETKLTISTNGSTSICIGSSIVLESSESSSYQWYKYGIAIEGANSKTYNASTEGIYTVSRLNSVSGCLAIQSDGIEVKVSSVPESPTVAVTQPTCEISTGKIVVTSPIADGYVYSIDGINYSNSSGIFSQVSAGTYNVSVKNANGCISSATSAEINLSPLAPALPVIEVVSPLCPQKTGSITVKSPVGNGITYSIDGLNYYANSGLFNSVAPGTYNVTVKNTSGCVSSAVIAVVKDPTVDDVKLTISVNGSSNICEGSSVVLTSSESINYQWYKYGIAIAGANAKTFVASTEGVYTVSKLNLNGCQVIQSNGVEVKVIVKPIAPLVSSNKVLFCEGDSVELKATSNFGLQWFRDGLSVNHTGSSYVVKQSGNYAAIAINSDGCRSSFSETIVLKMIDLPVTPLLNINGTAQFCKDEFRVLKVNVPLTMKVKWYKNGALISNYDRDTLKINEAGEYSVKFENTSGCLSLMSNKITAQIVCNATGIYVPDIFTPNGDGINDNIKPICVGISTFKYLKIYNRWGNILFESTDASKGWDGRFRGQIQPSDSYIWLVEGIDTNGKEIRKTGTLNLIK